MKSIQGQLRLGLIIMVLLVGAALAQLSLWLFETGVQRYLESGLRNESELLLVALIKESSGIKLDEHRLSPAYQRPYSGHYFRVDFPNAQWRSRSLWDLELPKPVQTGLGTYRELGNGQSLLLLRWDYRKFGQSISITVAQDYTPVRQTFMRVRQVGIGIGLAALVVLVLLQQWTVRRALKPLNQVREQVAQLQAGQRVQLDDQVSMELHPLVGQINHLLVHTEDTLKRSRHALGNLGHALKTPMAVLMSMAANDKLSAHPDVQRTLQQQLSLIQQRLNRELNRARLAGDTLPSSRFECETELAGLVATVQVIHGGHLDITWRAEAGLMMPKDREDVLELLGNLLDNACKWADSQVQVAMAVIPDGLRIEVGDDGPGIEPLQRERVLERGLRLDEQTEGHGLGLGIVRDIVEAWGGDLKLLESDLGGLLVRIDVPVRKASDQAG